MGAGRAKGLKEESDDGISGRVRGDFRAAEIKLLEMNQEKMNSSDLVNRCSPHP